MINPLRNLKGKLNHLRVPPAQLMRAHQTAAALACNGPSLGQDPCSPEDILALKSKSGPIDPRRFHRLEFQLMVHLQKASFGLPSTAFDDLTAYQKKVSLALSSFTAELTQRQLLYLNLALRSRSNGQFADWDRLHLAPQCPFRVESEVVPTLEAGSRLQELRSLPKRGVMEEVVRAKEEAGTSAEA